MPTKTKPPEINLFDGFNQEISFSENENQEIIDLLSLDETETKKNSILLLELSKIQTIFFNALIRQKTKPLPAGKRAALEKILRHSSELANALKVFGFEPDISKHLGDIDPGELWQRLTHLNIHASNGLEELNKRSKRKYGGEKKMLEKQIRDSCIKAFSSFFDKHAREAVDETAHIKNKAAFIDLFNKKLKFQVVDKKSRKIPALKK